MKEDFVVSGNAKDFESNEIFDCIIFAMFSYINLKWKINVPSFVYLRRRNNDNKASYYLKRADSRSGIEPSSFCLPTNNALPLGQAGLRGSDLFDSLFVWSPRFMCKVVLTYKKCNELSFQTPYVFHRHASYTQLIVLVTTSNHAANILLKSRGKAFE